jgi:hypothetical protein
MALDGIKKSYWLLGDGYALSGLVQQCLPLL